MVNKEKYIKFCEKEQAIPIFLKSWWLDAVCGKGRWDAAIVEQNGYIVGIMPYYYVTDMFKKKKSQCQC